MTGEAEAWPQARRVGVVADTHFGSRGRAYPPELLRGLEGVDLILHAGDLTSLSALEPLQAIAPVAAVAGNVDDPEVRALLPFRRVVLAGPCRVGLVHGHSGAGPTTPDRALRSFADADVAVVVFGHTHAPLCQERGGVLLLNPGSPTTRRHEPDFSFALLHLGERPWAEFRRWR